MPRWPAVIIASTVAVIALLMILAPAFARDSGQWEKADPNISRWFESLKQPDNPLMSCCGTSDAYWADVAETDANGNMVAVITDDRPDGPLGRPHVPVGTKIPVPRHKIKWDQGNPTGHIVIFLNASRDVLCYVQNGGV